MKNLQDIKTILILGCGTLGARIGLQCAISGFNVRCFDIKEEIFDQAQNMQAKILGSLARKQVLKEEDFDAITSRLTWTTDAEEASQGVDLVSESVTENVAIKKKVWQQFGPLCKGAILTTNTSYLLPSMFAEDSGDPNQFCAYHFHDVFQANVVDIMPHPGTDPDVVRVLNELAPKINQIPVILKQETSGYLFNAMLNSILVTAAQLAYNDISSIEDIDKSWMGNFKMAVGPFGMMDAIGLETVWHVSSNLGGNGSKFADFVKRYIDAGKLGVKSGEGFYKYPNPAYQDPDFLL